MPSRTHRRGIFSESTVRKQSFAKGQAGDIELAGVVSEAGNFTRFAHLEFAAYALIDTSPAGRSLILAVLMTAPDSSNPKLSRY
jgi:hypothetical protein